MDMARWLDEEGPDYAEAHVKLIDALRAYIRVNEGTRSDAIREGISPRKLRAGDFEMAQWRRMLARLEEFDFDPTLGGRTTR